MRTIQTRAHNHMHTHRYTCVCVCDKPTQSVDLFTYAFIREVNNEELDSEVDLSRLIAYMIDSNDEKVNFTRTRCLYSSMPLHHKDYWYRVPVSNVNECYNGCFRKVCHI